MDIAPLPSMLSSPSASPSKIKSTRSKISLVTATLSRGTALASGFRGSYLRQIRSSLIRPLQLRLGRAN